MVKNREKKQKNKIPGNAFNSEGKRQEPVDLFFYKFVTPSISEYCYFDVLYFQIIGMTSELIAGCSIEIYNNNP